MKYLITGGCGFLGSNIASEVLKQSDELLIYDNCSRVGWEENKAWLENLGSFNFLKADVRDIDILSQTIKDYQPDTIYHLAGQVAMTTSIANPRLDFETNILGSFNLLEAVRLYSPHSTVIYSSTNKVYGDLEYLDYIEDETRYTCPQHPKGLDEATLLDFHSPYGVSKGSADQYMLDWARIFDIKTMVFRHSSMYGSRQFGTFDQGWVSWFCQKALETKKDSSTTFTISGNGKQVRDVLYASDMVDLYVKAPQYIEKAKGQAFNIGGGMENSLSLLELFNILENKLNVRLNFEKLAPRESDQKIFVADITKAQAFFDWKPIVDKESGVEKTLSWLER